MCGIRSTMTYYNKLQGFHKLVVEFLVSKSQMNIHCDATLMDF